MVMVGEGVGVTVTVTGAGAGAVTVIGAGVAVTVSVAFTVTVGWGDDGTLAAQAIKLAAKTAREIIDIVINVNFFISSPLGLKCDNH